MTGWISTRIEKASWTGFIVWTAILFAYSYWAFTLDSPWTRALEAAGGMLPETQPGIPAIEPVRSLDALAAAKANGDYILWQALDIPYTVMNFFFAAIGMALGLKALRLDNSALRFLLILPAIYVACELLEDAILAGFAARLFNPSEGIVLVQQVATTLKMTSFMPAMLLSVIGVVIALIAAIIRKIRKPA